MKERFLTIALICSFGAVVSSCSMLDRRDFYNQMDNRFEDPMFSPFEDFEVVPGDQGAYYNRGEMMKRVPATATMRQEDHYRHSLSRELRVLESRLTDMEFEAYSRVRGGLGSDSERIYFLRLNPADRDYYLRAKGIQPKRYLSASQAMRGPSADISLGMERSDVLSYWGQPDQRDYAGNPKLGNERWAYRKNGQVKYIYFEQGQVEGWSEQ